MGCLWAAPGAKREAQGRENGGQERPRTAKSVAKSARERATRRLEEASQRYLQHDCENVQKIAQKLRKEDAPNLEFSWGLAVFYGSFRKWPLKWFFGEFGFPKRPPEAPKTQIFGVRGRADIVRRGLAAKLGAVIAPSRAKIGRERRQCAPEPPKCGEGAAQAPPGGSAAVRGRQVTYLFASAWRARFPSESGKNLRFL